MGEIVHVGKATSFADPADVDAFKKWKQIYLDQGYSDEEATNLAFRKGDDGIGLWGDDTSEGSGPSCALPPEDMEERWNAKAINDWREARRQMVLVTIGHEAVIALVKDRMPHRAHITNGAIIDLNPDACRALNVSPPLFADCTWSWLPAIPT
jgi:hypothetical protein